MSVSAVSSFKPHFTINNKQPMCITLGDGVKVNCAVVQSLFSTLLESGEILLWPQFVSVFI